MSKTVRKNNSRAAANKTAAHEGGLRQAMTWAHTWIGVLLGGVLMVAFFMGSVAVFDREVDRWMMPATRIEAAPVTIDIDTVVLRAVDALAAGKPLREWAVTLPEARTPVMIARVRYAAAGGQIRLADPRAGALLPDVGTLGASSFFYPLHYNLHLRVWNIGYWLVGLAAMAMLAAIVSGVIVHVRIFRDFFTFRPRKQLQRSLLDLHNLTGVLALPFHAVISFSGICIVYMILIPAGINALYQQPNAFYEQALSGYSRQAAGVAAPMAPLGPMVEAARARWGGAAPAAIRVWNPGDANAVVKVSRSVGDRVSLADDAAYFDGATGALLHHAPLQPAATTQRFLTGMHFIAFDHWPLRWLYFLGGLAGCVLIGTGQLYWLDKRHARHGERGVRLAAAVTAAMTTGLVIATLAMMVANRLLPMTLPSREFIEAGLFFLVWLATAIHARVAMRPGSRTLVPWRQQCLAIAVLALAAPVCNGLTTGDWLPRALARGQFAVAGVDIALLLTGALALTTARRVRQVEAARVAAAPDLEEADHAECA
ncbi:PepSY-associated TM helix domain-containing protein [Cupriavidus consociatus]|uniref:PepSY-associated TM helix domain-containing protein n=1 Tax=Cupriavidus consociatus TaxID=2821357 RepID=UPI0024DF90CA|nr:PepSY-associated TM helix domain-containing protein [Cupriavidus sp. LEh21]MDK2655627.1 PepSY-associated TM helix domain-containing protein [Cupriavidus sp. LEh21]